MKNIFSPFLIAIALGSAVSCNLDLFPETSLPYDKNTPMIQLPEDIAGFHRGIYANFRACQAGTYKIADDVMFDGFNATQEFGNRYGGLHRLDASFTSSDDYITGYWQSLYTAIKNYNIIIEQVPISTVDKSKYQDDLDALMADAKFARAWSYLQLARHYGKDYNPETAPTDLCVPLVTVYDQTARPSRATVMDIYDQIKKDLDDAYEVLKSVPGKNSSDVFTADAVNFMYANYFLDVEDYEHSYEYAEKVIKNRSQYDFCKSEADFKAEFFEDGGKEAIMLLPVSLTEQVGGYGEYLNYNSESNSPTKDAYKSGFIPSKTLLDAYEASDWRRRNWFENVRDIPFSTQGTYLKNGEFAVFVKFKGNPALNASGVIDGHVAPKPFSLPEIYLIAAEAAFKAEDPVNAQLTLTTLQNARKATPSTTVTLEEIQKEWFRETVGEGLRLECLKRWGIGYESREGQEGALTNNVLMVTKGYTDRVLEANDYHLCWPIPSYEIKVNSNLVQNEGYAAVED